MGMAVPQAAAAADLPGPRRTGWVCRTCRQAVTAMGGDPERITLTFHTATGKETGPNGHIAAPIEAAQAGHGEPGMAP